MSVETKFCRKCEIWLPLHQFYEDKRPGREGKRYSPCKTCRYVKIKQNYNANRKKRLAYARNYWLQDQYGLTSEQYEELWRRQEGRCALCGTHDDVLDKRLFVDHCHDTGKIRGLLCPPCNSALGVLGDTPEAFERVLIYLRKECLTNSL